MHIKKGKLSPKHNKVLHQKSDEYPITKQLKFVKNGNALRRKDKSGSKDTLRHTHTHTYKT